MYVVVHLLLITFLTTCTTLPTTEEQPSDHRNQVFLNKLQTDGLLEYYTNYKQYKKTFKKKHVDQRDERNRLAIYAKNVKKISDHNERYSRGEVSYKLGINQFSDMTSTELNVLNGYRSQLRKSRTHLGTMERSDLASVNNEILPEQIDWRTLGYVTPVKNQGHCGSCWAFSATGALEGQHRRKRGTLISLSEQNLVDCSSAYGNNGCNGGLMDWAFMYVRENGGLDTEGTYPYEGDSQQCRFNKRTVGTTDHGFIDLTAGNELTLQAAVALIGPIAVAMNAIEDLFHYTEGIFSNENCSPDELNHGVLVVGYGTDNVKSENGSLVPMDYWLVKNSWDVTWGEKGYLRIARNRNNLCGLASDASYPLV